MEAIRQYLKVEGKHIHITLPDDFDAEEVEVIILPASKYASPIPEWQMEQVKERTSEYLKNPSVSEDFDKALNDIENGL